MFDLAHFQLYKWNLNEKRLEEPTKNKHQSAVVEMEEACRSCSRGEFPKMENDHRTNRSILRQLAHFSPLRTGCADNFVVNLFIMISATLGFPGMIIYQMVSWNTGNHGMATGKPKLKCPDAKQPIKKVSVQKSYMLLEIPVARRQLKWYINNKFSH